MASGVSVIIPTRDRGRLLLEAVRSAVQAPTPAAEVIVVDAGSTDGSVEALAEFGAAVRVVHGGGNAARSRNVGAAAASCEFLGFLDSDDVMLEGKTTCLVDALDADAGAALVHGATEVIDEGGVFLPDESRAQRASFAKGERLGTSYASIAEFSAMFTSATLMRRSALFSVGGYDETLDAYEDWDLYLRLSLRWRLAYAPGCLATRYRIWAGNVGWRRTAGWTARVAEKHLAALPDLPPAERERARYGLLRRVAFSRHILVERAPARRAALAAVRIAPRAALRDAEIRRPLLRSFLPARMLRARRPA
ncbi:MAG: glycosyltransferase family 2 protein [Gaiellaceae bacterium]